MKRGDVWIALGLLALAGALLLLRFLPGREPIIYINGEAAVQSMVVNGVEIEIDGKRAKVADSPCGDKLCVLAGWLEKPGDIAVCLPQRVIIELRGVKEVDGVAY